MNDDQKLRLALVEAMLILCHKVDFHAGDTQDRETADHLRAAVAEARGATFRALVDHPANRRTAP
jgi:hypothetical protein